MTWWPPGWSQRPVDTWDPGHFWPSLGKSHSSSTFNGKMKSGKSGKQGGGLESKLSFCANNILFLGAFAEKCVIYQKRWRNPLLPWPSWAMGIRSLSWPELYGNSVTFSKFVSKLVLFYRCFSGNRCWRVRKRVRWVRTLIYEVGTELWLLGRDLTR